MTPPRDDKPPPGPPPRRRRRSQPPQLHLPSGYQAMWLFAMFDLPMKTPVQKRDYTHFRKLLLREGFSRLQFSVYGRYFVSEESSKAECERIAAHLPPDGQVRLLAVTERQFGKQRVFWGRRRKKSEPVPEQLLMF